MFSPFPLRSPLTFKRGSSRKVLENDPGLVSMLDEELWDWEVLGHPGSPTRASPAVTQPERWTIDPPSLPLRNDVISPALAQPERWTINPPVVGSLPLRNNVISPAITQLERDANNPHPVGFLRRTNHVVLRPLPAIPQFGRHTTDPPLVDLLRPTNNVVLRPLPTIPQFGRRTTDPALVDLLGLTNNVVLRPLRAAIPQLGRTTDPPPINLLRFPNDVVSRIFCHACLPIPGDEKWRRPFYPLWFGKLCRAWRRIAWATSELWTTVVVRVYHSDRNESLHNGHVKLLEEWLPRAQGRKLKVYFGEANGNQAIAPPLLLMKLLVAKSCEQWQDVHIQLSQTWEPLLDLIPIPPSPDGRPQIRTNHACGRIAGLYPHALSNLRSFVIEQSRSHSSQIPRVNLSRAPSLRSIGLLNVPIHLSDVAESFPCAQITQLTLSACTYWKPQDIFSLFPRLRSFYCANSLCIGSNEEVTHEKLQTLSIHTSGYESYELSACTRFMTFPSLKMLEIVKESRPIEYTQHILPLIERSKCHLTSLTLECFLRLEHDLIDLLFSLDTLVELRLQDSKPPVHRYIHVDANQRGLGRTFFDALDPKEEAPLLPNLEIFLYKGPLAVHAIDFIEPFIVRSRMRGAQNAGVNSVALLKQATITADQYSEVAEFSIAEYSDPRYIWEVVRMVEEGMLVLHNMDGSRWS